MSDMATVRGQRMLDSAPSYYQYARVYRQIQQAIADELDRLGEKDLDVQAQYFIMTATWGLTYWERTLGIPTILTDSYSIRRSRVLSKWRGFGQFKASLVKSVCESFVGGKVRVVIRVPQQEVVITFVDTYGRVPNMQDLINQVDELVPATLGVRYIFKFLTWDEFDAKQLTWDGLDAANITWNELEVWK